MTTTTQLAPATTDTKILLQSIADLLAGKDAPVLPSFGLGSGKGGAILFYCHYAALTGEARYYDLALAQLEQALAGLSIQTYKSHAGSNYYQELAELGQLLCYLVAQGHLEWDNESLLSKIDALLADRMQHFLARKNLEIIDGALAMGTYFLRRAPHSAMARQQLDILLDAIQALREGDQSSGYYWTCHVIVEPRVYTGISHGSAMIISFLSAVHQAGIRPQECEELLHHATAFVLSVQQDPHKFISSFPLWQGREEATPNLCLVYGDLGTAYAIARAANILGNEYYLSEAIRIGLLTTQRLTAAETFLHDASIWYGMAGTHLLYDALHRQTGVAAFAAAAAYWLEQLPKRARHQNEYLGFSSYFFHQQPSAQLGFNFGVLGIGLTLIQALSQGRYSLDEFVWLS